MQVILYCGADRNLDTLTKQHKLNRCTHALCTLKHDSPNTMATRFPDGKMADAIKLIVLIMAKVLFECLLSIYAKPYAECFEYIKE